MPTPLPSSGNRLLLAALVLLCAGALPVQGARPDHIAQVDLVPGQESRDYRTAAIDPAAKLLYTLSNSYNFIGVTDLTTNLVVAQIPVPSGGIKSLVLDSAGHRLFGISGTSALYVIDTAARTATTVTLPSTVHPTDLAYDAGLGRIYLSNSGPGGVTELDSGSYAVVQTLATGPSAASVTFSPSTHAVYATSQVSASDSTSKLCVFDPNNATPTDTVPLGETGGFLRYVAGVDRVYIAAFSSQSLIPVDATSHAVLAKVPLPVQASVFAVGGGMIYGGFYFSSGVDALDTSTGQVSNLALGSGILGLAANPDSGELIALQGQRAVRVLGGQITGSVALGASPSAVALYPARHRRYVASGSSQSLLVFADDGTAITNIALDGAPSDVVVNPVTDRVYAVLPGPGTLVAIDAATNAVLFERPLTVEVSPGDLENLGPAKLALDSLHNRLYVLQPGANTWVTVVDGSVDGAAADPVNHQAFGPYGGTGRALAVDPAAQTVYLAATPHVDAGQPTERDTKAVVALSGTSGAVLATLLDPQTPITGYFASLVYNPASAKIYATTTDASGHCVVDIFSGTGGGASYTFLAGLSKGNDTYAGPLAVNPGLNRVYVYTGTTSSRAVLHTIDGASNAFDPAFDPTPINGPTGLAYDSTSQQVVAVSGSDALGGLLHVYFDGPDTVPPTGTILSPAPGSQDAAILLTSGSVQVSDDRSAIAAVDISLQNPDGQYWNGSDWVSSDTEVFFPAATNGSGTYAFPMPTRAQGLVRGAYTLHARLTDAAGNVTIKSSQFSIINPGGFSFSQANYPVNEGDPVTVTVQRDGGSDGTATVRYSLSDGTARIYETQVNESGHGFVSEGDYRLTNDPDYAQPATLPQATFLLTFGPGVTTQTFTFPTVSDTLVEGPQTIRLELEQVSPGAELGIQCGALVTINDRPPANAVASFAKAIQILDGVQVDNVQHMQYDAGGGKLYAQGQAGLSTGIYAESSVAVINTQTGLRESSFPLDGAVYGQIGIDPALNRLYALRLARGVNGGSYYSDLFFSVYDLTTHRRIGDTELTQTHGNVPDGTLVVDRSTHRVYALGASGTAVYNGQTGQFESTPLTTVGAANDLVGFNEKTGLLYIDNYGSLAVANSADGSISSLGDVPADGGIAINQTTGAVYAVAGSGGGTKKLSRLSGVSVSASVDLPGRGESVTVDEVQNQVLVVESFSTNQAQVYTYDGDTLAQIGSAVSIPSATQLKPPLVYVPDQHQLYLGNFYDAATTSLRHLDLTSGALAETLTAAHPSETATIHTTDYDKTYAASVSDRNLFVVDGRSDTLLNTIKLPGVASELTPVDSLGRLYFICTVSAYSATDQQFENTNHVMVLDCATDTLLNLQTIDSSILSTGAQNQSDNYGLNTIMRADATAKKLYVEAAPYAGSSSTISLVDIDPAHTQAFHTVLAQRAFPASDVVSLSSMIASPVRHRLYLVAAGGANNLQRLFTLDGSDLSTVSTGEIVSGSIFQNYPAGLAIDTAADRIYVQSDQEETYIMDVNPASSTYNQLVGDQRVSQYYGGVGYGSISVAVDPVTHHAFVSDDGQDQTVGLVLDGQSKTFTDTLLEIGQCEFLSVNPATQKMYAASSPLGKITVFLDQAGSASTLAVPAVPQVTATLPAALKSRITLESTEASSAAGLKVRFQYQLSGQTGWNNLPAAQHSGAANWVLTTTAVPAGDVVFRAVASATNDEDQPSSQTASLHVYAVAPLATPTLVNATFSPSTGKWTFTITDKVAKTTTLEVQYSKDGVTYLDVPGTTITPGAAGRFLVTTTAMLPGDAGFFRVLAKDGSAPDSIPSRVYSRYGLDASIAPLTLPSRVGPFIGSKVLSITGAGETITFRAPEGVRETCLIHVMNAGSLPDTLLAQGDSGDSQFVVRYYANAGTTAKPAAGAEITSQVIGGTWPLTLAAGGSGDLIAEVITIGNTPRNTIKSIAVTWHSQHDPTQQDTVKLTAMATDSKNTVFVTTGADSGDGSLRAALLWAQTHKGTTIEFEVPQGDPHFVTEVNFPVLHLHPATPLPALTGAGTIIDGVSQAEFEGFIGSSPLPAVYLEGDEVTNYQQGGFNALTGSNGLLVQAANCQVRGLTIEEFSQGVNITGAAAAGTTVQGCQFQGNYYAGVKIDSNASHSLIGGATAVQRNIFRAETIAGKTYGEAGVLITGEAHDNLVQGNFIGTSDTGEKSTGSLGLQTAGIVVASGLHNAIGGTLAGQGNVIGGSVGGNSPGSGIEIGTPAVTIQGNWIGCTAGLSGPVTANPNGYGIFFSGGGSGSQVGAASGLPNVISGNQLDGIRLAASLTNIILVNNTIGLSPDGATALPNLGNGIASSATSVGILGNHLSGNNAFGIFLAGGVNPLATQDLIRSNVIGLGRDGSTQPNGLGGIELRNVTGVKIGDGTAGSANLITKNLGAGIGVDGSYLGNSFRVNEIFDNEEPGIDLRPTGGESDPATPNDPGDADALQNYPVITSVTRSGKSFIVKFDFDARPNTKYAFDLYLNLASSDASRKGGKIFLRTLHITTPKTSGHVAPAVTILDGSKFSGVVLTATATNLGLQTTSEYSNAVAIP